ncbi:MAG: hypothetical protein K1X79_10740 [Oligoflexia bacterium]|nr:hypothetical protein [Oligoflexia bacterium]
MKVINLRAYFFLIAMSCFLRSPVAWAEPAPGDVCAEDSTSRFFWDVGTEAGTMKQVLREIERATSAYETECKAFCAENKCPLYNAHHHHEDGSSEINSGSVDQMTEAAQDAGNLVPDISVPFVSAAWEYIIFHCVCLNEGPVGPPVPVATLESQALL